MSELITDVQNLPYLECPFGPEYKEHEWLLKKIDTEKAAVVGFLRSKPTRTDLDACT